MTCLAGRARRQDEQRLDDGSAAAKHTGLRRPTDHVGRQRRVIVKRIGCCWASQARARERLDGGGKALSQETSRSTRGQTISERRGYVVVDSLPGYATGGGKEMDEDRRYCWDGEGGLSDGGGNGRGRPQTSPQPGSGHVTGGNPERTWWIHADALPARTAGSTSQVTNCDWGNAQPASAPAPRQRGSRFWARRRVPPDGPPDGVSWGAPSGGGAGGCAVPGHGRTARGQPAYLSRRSTLGQARRLASPLTAGTWRIPQRCARAHRRARRHTRTHTHIPGGARISTWPTHPRYYNPGNIVLIFFMGANPRGARWTATHPPTPPLPMPPCRPRRDPGGNPGLQWADGARYFFLCMADRTSWGSREGLEWGGGRGGGGRGGVENPRVRRRALGRAADSEASSVFLLHHPPAQMGRPN